jgi:hypothetical protein
MRLLALALLLVNVLLLAWARYAPDPGATESQLLNQQIRPEAIRVLPPEEAAAFGGTAEARADADKRGACIEWGAFNTADVVRARAMLEGVVPPERISERQLEDAAGWWVYLPPQGSRQSAIQKAAELKRLGIDDYFVVQEDPKFRFAISLGVFRTEEAARSRLEEVHGRGVPTARVGTRQTPVHKVFLQLRQPPEGVRPKLAELKDAFPGAELGGCR